MKRGTDFSLSVSDNEPGLKMRPQIVRDGNGCHTLVVFKGCGFVSNHFRDPYHDAAENPHPCKKRKGAAPGACGAQSIFVGHGPPAGQAGFSRATSR